MVRIVAAEHNPDVKTMLFDVTSILSYMQTFNFVKILDRQARTGTAVCVCLAELLLSSYPTAVARTQETVALRDDLMPT
jgi:hypothetical protein